MKTNRTLLVAAALCLSATVATFPASAHLGTWKLNEAKSKFAPGATQNITVTYTEAKGDMLKLSVDGVDKDGKKVHWTWVGKFGGQPYKVKGSATADEISYKELNDHTNELTIMKSGKAVMTGAITVAKDGKSRVVKTTATDSNGKKHTDRAYYEKQ